MTLSKQSDWPKRIRVDRKIVNVLSRSLYADFPRALREMISNSFDADSTSVKINIDRSLKEITVEDNGNGMSTDQFDNYLRIAGEKMGGAVYSPKFQRSRIGRFGVGFLASFPFCESLEISSKREGADFGFTAKIPAARFVKGIGQDEEISSIPVDGYNEAKPEAKTEHYTRIRMIGLNPLAEEYFRERLPNRRVTIEAWDGIQRLEWQLRENLPLDFEKSNSDLSKYLVEKNVGMEVWLNGKRLYRNDQNGQVIESSKLSQIKLGNLEFKYAVTTNWSVIHPVEARGVKIRVNNVGVGPRTYLDLEREGRYFSRMNWLTGEVQIARGLDESIALNRDSFTWSSEYQALKDFMQKILSKAANYVESVAETEKISNEYFTKEKLIQQTTPIEVVEQSAKALGSANFEVVHVKRENVKDFSGKMPIIIDKPNRMLKIIDDHPSLTNPPKYDQVRYKIFEGSDRNTTPIRLAKDGVIEINNAYPIFSGKTKGGILKAVHLIVFSAKISCKTKEEMYDLIVKRLREEYGD